MHTKSYVAAFAAFLTVSDSTPILRRSCGSKCGRSAVAYDPSHLQSTDTTRKARDITNLDYPHAQKQFLQIRQDSGNNTEPVVVIEETPIVTEVVPPKEKRSTSKREDKAAIAAVAKSDDKVSKRSKEDKPASSKREPGLGDDTEIVESTSYVYADSAAPIEGEFDPSNNGTSGGNVTEIDDTYATVVDVFDEDYSSSNSTQSQPESHHEGNEGEDEHDAGEAHKSKSPSQTKSDDHRDNEDNDSELTELDDIHDIGAEQHSGSEKNGRSSSKEKSKKAQRGGLKRYQPRAAAAAAATKRLPL